MTILGQWCRALGQRRPGRVIAGAGLAAMVVATVLTAALPAPSESRVSAQEAMFQALRDQALPAFLERTQKAVSLTEEWRDYVTSLTRPVAAPSVSISIADEVARRMQVEPAVADDLVQQYGATAALYIARIREIQLGAEDPREAAREMAQVASSLAGIIKANPAAIPLAGENDEAPVPDNLFGSGYASGSYGSNGGVYIAGTLGRSYEACCYSFGFQGGLFIDLGGDDDYTAVGDYSSWTAHSFGSAISDGVTSIPGVFIDLAGNDEYSSFVNSFGSTGAGCPPALPGLCSNGLNAGIFIDIAGDDDYAADTRSFGAGTGVFMDLEGDDDFLGSGYALYESFGAGNCDWFCTSLGRFNTMGGLFINVGGNDAYPGASESYGAGTNAVFLEVGGNDRYLVGGSGYSSRVLGVYPEGLFIDFLGDDEYGEPSTYVDSAAGNLGGIFVEVSGDDVYRMDYNALGTQLEGLFLELSGDDVYEAEWSSLGGGCIYLNNCIPPAGNFCDIGGNDDYPEYAYSSFGEEPGSVFCDTEDPGLRGEHNLQYTVSGIALPPPPMGIPSPVTPLLKSLADQVTIDLVVRPQVAAPAALLGFDLVFNASVPVEIKVVDDQGQRLTLDPPGTAEGLDGVYFSNGVSQTLTANYVAAGPGRRDFIVVARDIHGLNQFQRLTFGTLEIDALEPAIKVSFWDGADSTDLFVHHAESNEVGGANVAVTDLGAGLADVFIKESEEPVPGLDAPAWSGTIDADGRGAAASPSQFVGLADLTEGAHDFFVLARDAVGNEARSSFTLLVDRSMPTFTATLTGGQLGSAGWYTIPPTIEVAATDKFSGVDGIEYRFEGATQQDWREDYVQAEGGQVVTREVAPDDGYGEGKTTMDLTVRDNAHAANVLSETAVLEFSFDGSPPLTTDSLKVDERGVAPLLITLTAQDEGSGLAKTYHKFWREGATEPAEFSTDGLLRADRAGTWNIAYYSTDRAGNEEALATKTVDVDTSPPVASFIHSPTEVFGATSVRFTDASTDLDGQIVSRRWDFGDGETANALSPDHVFADDGLYTVRLTVTDNDNASATTAVEIVVKNRGPISQFAPSTTLQRAGRSVSFLERSVDLDGEIVTRAWAFGDGATSTQPNPVHVFTTAGLFPITLTVTDDDGAQHASTVQVRVLNNLMPTPAFELPSGASTRLTEVPFEDKSTDDVAVSAWAWNFGDGGASQARNPTHKFPAAGVYNVTLAVTDNEGATATITKTMAIGLVVPRAQIQASKSEPLTNERVFLNATANEEESRVATWTWDFDDGTTATGQKVSKSYPVAGLRVVKLHVRNLDGGESVTSQSITVKNQAPRVDFSISPSLPTYASDVQFRDASKDVDGSVRGWLWSFGDGGVTQEANPVHRYEKPGTYSVELTVTDADGAQSTVRRQLRIEAIAPIADFAASDDRPLVGEVVHFFDYSSDPDRGALSFLWDFGDGSLSNAREPEHAYDAGGTHKVRLTVTDSDGKKASLERVVIVASEAALATPSATPILPTSSVGTQPSVPGHEPTGPAEATAAETAPDRNDANAGPFLGSLVALVVVALRGRRRWGQG